MPLSAQVKAECDHCGAVLESGAQLHEGTEGLRDIWDWAIPDGWIRRREETMYGRQYRIWCSDECVVAWLVKRGRNQEAESYRDSAWIA